MPETQAIARVVQRRIIVFDENDQPVLTTQPVLSQGDLKSLYSIVAAQPYVVDPLNPADLDFDGMTVAEVLVRKQIMAAARTGDAGLIETVMDRLIGKPKSTSENLNVNVSGSYEEFLKRKAAELAGVQEAEVVRPFGDLG